MRKSVHFLIVCFILLYIVNDGFSDEAKQSTNSPRLELSSNAIHLGGVEPRDNILTTVQIRNSGTSDLEIKKIVALCSCVQLNMNTLTLAPGQAQNLEIRTMLKTYTNSKVHGVIRIYSNDPEQSETDIVVEGRILPEYTTSPFAIDFGKTQIGETPTKRILVTQTGTEPIVIKRVEATAGLEASFGEVKLKPSSTKKTVASEKKKAKQFYIDVSLNSDIAGGPFNGKVTLFTNIKRLPKSIIPVTARVIGLEYTVLPRVLTFGTAAPGDDVGAFTIKSSNDIHILSAHSIQDTILLEIVEIVPSREYDVGVSLKPNTPVGRLMEKVQLQVGAGSVTETVEVTVYGKVQ